MLIQKARSSNRRDTGDCLLGEVLLDGFLLGGMKLGEITTKSGEKAEPKRTRYSAFTSSGASPFFTSI